MQDTEQVIDGLFEAGNRLEILAESLAVESRQVRHRAQQLRDRIANELALGIEPHNGASLEAALNKLHGDVERDVRYQLDTVRDVLRYL